MTRNTVVIKRYPPRKDDIGEETFITEIKMLGTCKHPRIVKLLGFCVDDSEMILVIEHLPNQYLEDYWINLNLRPFLTWAKRLKICLDIANALNYLHYEMEDQKTIIHRDIKSYYIALDENWGAKIVDFRYSVFLPPNQDGDALYHNSYIGTREYIDPEYRGTGKLKRESDVYGFGVVLFEVLCGRLAYDPIYLMESEQGLAFVARRCFREGTLIEMIDPILKEPRGENDFILNRGPNKYSLKKFVNIAYKCIAETQDRRPTIKVVIQELQDALFFQEEEEHVDRVHVADEVEESMELTLSPNYAVEEEHLDMVHVADEVEELMELTFTPDYAIKKLENLKIPLSDILLATENFSATYRIVPTSYKYLEFYRAELEHFDVEKPSIKEEENKSDMCRTRNTVVIERFRPRNQIEIEMFYTEFKMLNTCKHPNIIKLLGFCVEDSEMIIVVEHLSNAYLYDYWKNTDMRHTLTWEKRLKICLDVANALNYLQTEMEDQKAIIHRGIMSYNIELDENWGAKVIGFQLSVFLPPNQDDDTLYHSFRSGVLRYRDPEYWETGKLKRESDVYSFGVVLFEILCGRLAYDPIYLKESEEFGLAFVARQCFQEGTLTEMIDPILKEQRGEKSLTLNRGPNKDSLEKFVKIAHRCIATTQDKRPTMKVVIQELQDALFFQENNKDEPKISLEVIRLATKNFDDENCIGRGGFGNVYKGEVPQGDRLNTIIVAKRLDTRLGQGEQQFRNEIQILFEYKHENIISLVGYCDEEKEKIIVYEYASQGSLNNYLKDVRLTWVKRLDICIDVATALAFLHGGAGKQAIVIHRDIKTDNILLINDEWHAKLADFGLSLISPINQETDYVIDHACGTRGYLDPLYMKSGFLTKESDIYSFGVVLFEIMSGRSTFEIYKRNRQHLPDFTKVSFENGKHDDLVFEALKEQIVPKALTAFQTIAYQCLHDDREKRPTAKEVLQQLKEAREFQRQAMREHDEALEKLNGTEISTKPIALVVNEKPDLHTRLIDDLDEHVEVTDDLADFWK
uniref:uncharacterized protein LOC122582638 isoform X2 n=1 Tax=Erigeron canadensis TaxID=72917 RepID=UPI001CB911ED|nr:uncharacterized protein LOC122582638 isoform X2 [Erigeron canadensis]